jgi:hypothetical protein
MAITALPTPPSRANSPADFSNRADALLSALPTFVSETNAVQADLNAKKAAFDTDYANAMASGLANAAANAATATTKAAQAAGSASTAQTAASAADAAWAAALASNPDLNPVFRMNPSTISADTTLPAGYNAHSAGPLVIGEGVSVTLEDNANWTIV